MVEKRSRGGPMSPPFFHARVVAQSARDGAPEGRKGIGHKANSLRRSAANPWHVDFSSVLRPWLIPSAPTGLDRRNFITRKSGYNRLRLFNSRLGWRTYLKVNYINCDDSPQYSCFHICTSLQSPQF